MPETDAGDDREARHLYDRRALEEASVAGLYAEEIDEVLRGRLPTDVVPPWPGEDVSNYADRAVSEFLLLYLSHWRDGPSG